MGVSIWTSGWWVGSIAWLLDGCCLPSPHVFGSQAQRLGKWVAFHWELGGGTEGGEGGAAGGYGVGQGCYDGARGCNGGGWDVAAGGSFGKGVAQWAVGWLL